MHIPIEIRNQQGRGSGVRGNRGSRVYPLIKANTPSLPSITPGSLLRFAVRRDDNVSNRASGSGDGHARSAHTELVFVRRRGSGGLAGRRPEGREGHRRRRR